MKIQSIEFQRDDTLLLRLDTEWNVYVPLSKFPAIAQLDTKQREDFEIIDDRYLSFLAIDEVYYIPDLISTAS